MSEPIDPNAAAPSASRQRGAGLARLAGYALILGVGLGAAALFHLHADAEYSRALDKHRSLSLETAKRVAACVEERLNRVYRNLRLIGMLPSVTKLDRRGAEIDADARMSIQRIYEDLAVDIDLSGLYVTLVDFDPEAIDPITGRAEKPSVVFDQRGAAFTEARSRDAAPRAASLSELTLPEIEIFEFLQLRDLMARLREEYPTAAAWPSRHPPVLGGAEVLTHDNTDYDRTQNDLDRMGVMFSTPFYGADGALRGSVSAVLRTNALRRLLPSADYMLANIDTRFVTARPSTRERDASAWALGGAPDPDLLFSAVLPLTLENSHNPWRLWVGQPNAAFLDSPELKRISHRALLAYACCLAGTVLALLLWAVSSRRRAAELAQWRDLSHASVEGLAICDGDRLVAANRSFDALLGAPPGGVAGRDLSALIHDEDVRRGLHALDGESIEAAMVRDDGAEIPVEIISREITYGGRPHRALAVRDLRARKEAEETMLYLARHDPLTHLANRRRYNEVLDAAMAQAGSDAPFAVLCLDLDRFKPVNDALGHPVGDELLRQVARRLEECVCEGDTVARIGGDEFAIVQMAADQPQAASELADRIIQALTTPFMIQQHRVTVGTSVGAAVAPHDGAESCTLLRNADLALYRAKTDGRGVCRLFEDGMDVHVRERRKLEVDLKNALALNEFELHYQPQIGAVDGHVRSLEALLRWRHPYRGVLEAAEFLPLAEELGLMRSIDAWVMFEACRQALTWPEHLRVTVNVSPRQFEGGAVELQAQEALGASGLAADRLELEVTEAAFLADADAAFALLRRLRDAGVRVALDDFGAGYSSLGILSRFPFDKVKIDGEFLRRSDEDPTAAAIIRAVIGLCEGLGMPVTAEGVETEAQRARMTQEGCAELQGHLFGRQVPAKKLPELLKSLERRAAAMAQAAAG